MGNKISKLQVSNFRNLQGDIIQFGAKINCIFGENGNGKTNILEAIYVLALKKSFRKNSSFPQFLGIDGEKPEIIISSVFLNQNNEAFSYSARLLQDSSEWSLNGKPVKKRPEIALVFVNPSDAYQFHNQASFRRQWFDQHIGMLDSGYKKLISKYTTILRNRNTLLSKKPSYYHQQLDVLDEMMAKISVEILEKRKSFINEIGGFCKQAFQDVFSENHELKISLESKFLNCSVEQIQKTLLENRPKEELMGFTKNGIHKDDYVLLFDGYNSYEFCSLGQQKMSYLSLLFAYVELFRYKFMSFPIVLIDDVSGELDSERWQRLVHFLERSQFQVLITTANEKFKEELDKIEGAQKIIVHAGTIITPAE